MYIFVHFKHQPFKSLSISNINPNTTIATKAILFTNTWFSISLLQSSLNKSFILSRFQSRKRNGQIRQFIQIWENPRKIKKQINLSDFFQPISQYI